MVDKHLMDQMENILSRLTIPVAIMDKDPETCPLPSSFRWSR